MTTPQQNTKVEMLVEAIESFAIAIARDIAYPPAPGVQAACADESRKDARADMASALREFLSPTLRVITEHEKRVGDVSMTSRRTVESFGSDAPPPRSGVRPGHKDICTKDRCHCGPQ